MSSLTNAYGLIIGIANYKHIPSLSNAVINDAQDIHDILVNPEFCAYPPNNVKLLLDAFATRPAILQELDWLSKVTNQDSTVWIYFSGHGGRLLAGRNSEEYILPFNAKIEDIRGLQRSAISGDKFSNVLSKIRARKIVIFFDSCHSGGFGVIKGSGGLKNGLSNNYYERLASGRGRVIISSSRDEEPSWILEGQRNSLFTLHLLNGLRGGASREDGFVHILDIFRYVQEKVIFDKPEQHPILKVEIEDDFAIAFSPTGKKTVGNENILSRRNVPQGKEHNIVEHVNNIDARFSTGPIAIGSGSSAIQFSRTSYPNNNTTYCRKCNKQHKSIYHFCPNCGEKLIELGS